MFELNLPSKDIIVYMIAVSAIVSYAIVEIIKKAIDGLQKVGKLKQELWWHRSLCRLVSIVTGALAGFVIFDISGLFIGASSGAINTTIVALVKKFLKRKSKSLSEEDKKE